jgi:hypothetical protein
MLPTIELLPDSTKQCPLKVIPQRSILLDEHCDGTTFDVAIGAVRSISLEPGDQTGLRTHIL